MHGTRKDETRKQKLLHWIQGTLPRLGVEDFSTSWQDGLVLCFLMEEVGNDLCYIEPGDMGECNGDKKHCCFIWELNYGLNSDLKQRYYAYAAIKGSISNFRSTFFHSFSFFSKLRFPLCLPVRYNTGPMFLYSKVYVTPV